jgi:hypothetical protein
MAFTKLKKKVKFRYIISSYKPLLLGHNNACVHLPFLHYQVRKVKAGSIRHQWRTMHALALSRRIKWDRTVVWDTHYATRSPKENSVWPQPYCPDNRHPDLFQQSSLLVRDSSKNNVQRSNGCALPGTSRIHSPSSLICRVLSSARRPTDVYFAFLENTLALHRERNGQFNEQSPPHPPHPLFSIGLGCNNSNVQPFLTDHSI